jgi:hypothetical protein
LECARQVPTHHALNEMYVNALANGNAAGGKPADMFLLTVTMSKFHADVP